MTRQETRKREADTLQELNITLPTSKSYEASIYNRDPVTMKRQRVNMLNMVDLLIKIKDAKYIEYNITMVPKKTELFNATGNIRIEILRNRGIANILICDDPDHSGKYYGVYGTEDNPDILSIIHYLESHAHKLGERARYWDEEDT